MIRLGVGVFVAAVLSFDAATLQAQPHPQPRPSNAQLTAEQTARMKEAQAANQRWLTASSSQLMARAERERQAFLDRNRERRLASNKRVEDFKVKLAKRVDSPSQARIQAIRMEASQLMARYSKAGANERERMDARASALQEELNRINH